ncbi:MAG: hypothetical protein FD145_658 [Candidatus Saganbacteria bacterium]|uniref:Uncharacterized protein n=1 Tax=Candidatus Saganbacteria bacterium TaxID=2575572 RepID=A0A833L1F0_UNCSA|nr:MAG: hypothetical protein FD145_658 [Candidatus Saganbacteria bacterium]
MKIIKDKISIEELKERAQNRLGEFVKAVVDIENEVMAVDAELHADEEVLLLQEGSKQDNLWGINIYPEMKKEERIEFDSMVNIKPHLGNRNRSINDKKIQERIITIVDKLVKDGLS